MAYNPEDRPLPEDVLDHPWFAPVAAAVAQQAQQTPAAGAQQVQHAQVAAEPKELEEERGVVPVAAAQGAPRPDAAAAAGSASGAAPARSSMGV